jgi:FtsZ-binding cell division protein ZapB
MGERGQDQHEEANRCAAIHVESVKDKLIIAAVEGFIGYRERRVYEDGHTSQKKEVCLDQLNAIVKHVVDSIYPLTDAAGSDALLKNISQLNGKLFLAEARIKRLQERIDSLLEEINYMHEAKDRSSTSNAKLLSEVKKLTSKVQMLSGKIIKFKEGQFESFGEEEVGHEAS